MSSYDGVVFHYSIERSCRLSAVMAQDPTESLALRIAFHDIMPLIGPSRRPILLVHASPYESKSRYKAYHPNIQAIYKVWCLAHLCIVAPRSR